jgi:hypothetical protein
VSVTRRRMKSSDMSKSFTENTQMRQQSLKLTAKRAEDKKGGRMLSLNAETIDNSLKNIDPDIVENMERKNKLIKLAKLR